MSQDSRLLTFDHSRESGKLFRVVAEACNDPLHRDLVLSNSIGDVQRAGARMKTAYYDHDHAEDQVENEKPSKNPIRPVEQGWIEEIHRVSVQPYRKSNLGSERD